MGHVTFFLILLLNYVCRVVVVLHLAFQQDSQCANNIETRSCKYCCYGKAISVTYSEIMFVALGIQRAMRMRHNVICGLPGSAVFIHIVSRRARLSEKRC